MKGNNYMSIDEKNNERPTFFKYAVLIAITLCICVISIALIIANSDRKKTGLDILSEKQEASKIEKEKSETDQLEVETDEIEETNSSHEQEEQRETLESIEEVEQEFENLDVEAEVEQIRSWYYSPTESEEKFVLSKGTDGWNYSREYYFHEGKLYFVFIYNGLEEHRLYFKDDIMIRYIDENKSVYDYGNTNEFFDWESRALSESKQFYE